MSTLLSLLKSFLSRTKNKWVMITHPFSVIHITAFNPLKSPLKESVLISTQVQVENLHEAKTSKETWPKSTPQTCITALQNLHRLYPCSTLNCKPYGWNLLKLNTREMWAGLEASTLGYSWAADQNMPWILSTRKELERITMQANEDHSLVHCSSSQQCQQVGAGWPA